MFTSEKILIKLLTIPAILIGFTFHEYAHALVADRLGDKTPKFQGRLTLNPFAHIDIIGFLMILLVGFGWAKPVQTNPNAYKNYYKDDLKVSIAGPFANIIVAFVFAILTGLFLKIMLIKSNYNNLQWIILNILKLTVQINLMLFFFNLIPLPGLDGFHILRDLFPKFFYNISDYLYKYQMVIILIFIITPAAHYIVGMPTQALYKFFMGIAGMI